MVYAMIVAGFMAGSGFLSEIVGVFSTETECTAFIQEVKKMQLADGVIAVGHACVKIEEVK